MFDQHLRACQITLSPSPSFEAVYAYVHWSSFNGYVICLYRPGSRAATDAFFDDLSGLLESVATFTSPVIVIGVFNIHVDVATDPTAIKFDNVLKT